MNYLILLETCYPKDGAYAVAGIVEKRPIAESPSEAEKEARELVRRNRKSNFDSPQLRFRVTLTCAGKIVWKNDETAGDLLIEPDETTTVTCSA